MTKKQKLRHDDKVGNKLAGGVQWEGALQRMFTERLKDLYYAGFTHGDWVGQEWSDGKRQSSVVGYATSRDEFDQTGKEHDIGIALGKRKRDDLDEEFIQANKWKGIKRTFAAFAVGAERARRNIMTKVHRRPVMTRIPLNKLRGVLKPGDDSKTEPSQPNTEPATNLITATNKMATGGNDGEVPVAAVPRAISKIHPDHFNIRLPYVWRQNILNSSCTSAHDEPVVLIRLNSIYDVLKQKNSRIDYQINPNSELATAALTAANANDPVAAAIARAVIDQSAAFNPTGTTNSGSGGPQGRNIWQAHFKYYRVLRSDVKITFFNKNSEMTGDTGSAPANVGAMRNHYVVGFELVDEDGQLSDTTEMFLMTKNAERQILGPAQGVPYQIGGAGQTYPYANSVSHAVMQYSYDPMNWNYHVEQTSGVETRWTAIGSNPTLDHLLAIRMFHLDTTDQSFGSWYNLGCMVQIEYEVQFMECLDSFYKTQYRPTATNT